MQAASGNGFDGEKVGNDDPMKKPKRIPGEIVAKSVANSFNFMKVGSFHNQ